MPEFKLTPEQEAELGPELAAWVRKDLPPPTPEEQAALKDARTRIDSRKKTPEEMEFEELGERKELSPKQSQRYRELEAKLHRQPAHSPSPSVKLFDAFVKGGQKEMERVYDEMHPDAPSKKAS